MVIDQKRYGAQPSIRVQHMGEAPRRSRLLQQNRQGRQGREGGKRARQSMGTGRGLNVWHRLEQRQIAVFALVVVGLGRTRCELKGNRQGHIAGFLHGVGQMLIDIQLVHGLIHISPDAGCGGGVLFRF